MTESSITIPRPPEGIRPAGFWEEWLPGVLKDFMEVIKENAGALDAILSVRVTGDGGGEWSVVVKDGEARIERGLRDDAFLALALSVKDFHDAVTGRRDDLIPGEGGLSGELDPARVGAAIRNAVATLGKIKGSLLFRASHPSDPFECLLKFKGEWKPEPDTVVKIDQGYLREMRLSGIGLVTAFMGGKIRISGAMDLVLNFMPLLT
ncbi:MAG TPA: SCP2 sterol-binding domain-containing protein [bacterium]|nr:SCP2 sterol-binding domain-containing protein [bacterium]